MNAPSDRSAFTPFNPNAKPPDELYLSRSWIGWRLEYDPENPDAKPKKIPVVLVEGVSVRDYLKPHAHVSYDEAVKAFVARRHANGRRRLDGVGFVFTPEDNKLGGDLDKCRDPITGTVQDWAQKIIDKGETYFELSPSGTGVKFFALNHTSGRVVVKNNPAGVEVYSEKRFFTFTGDHVAGTPMELGQAPQAVAAMVQRDVDFKRGVKASPGSSASQSPSGNGLGEAQKPAGGPSAASGDEDEGAKAFERHVSDKAFFRQVNDAALAKREKWVPKAFQKAKPPTSTNSAWRIPSASIGRPDLVEDLSIHATGTTWYGVYDGEDAERKGKRTAINVILEHGPEDLRGSFDDMAAVMRVTLWLAEQLGLSDDDLKAMGWRGGETPMPENVEPIDLWPSAGALPPLPVGLLPQRIETFARAAAIVVGADDGGFAMAALAVAAGSLDDAIKLSVMPYAKWVESARIWVALVGDPSTKKTPIINTTYEALKSADNALYRLYAAAKAKWEMLSKPDKAITPAPVRNRYLISDTTSEAAQEAFRTIGERGLFGVYDELGGWFGSMERYGQNGSGASERRFWLEAYNGGSYLVDRIGRGAFMIANLSLTILGGIQPDLIRKVASAPSDDGLIQRIIPIVLRPGWTPVADQNAASQMGDFDALIPQLLALCPPNSGHLSFDAGAQKIRDDLAKEHENAARVMEGFNKKLSTALGKQDGVFARLCVVWHCIENASQSPLPEIVTEDIARRVAAFMREFTRPHLFHFYGVTLDLPDEHERLLSIAGYILTHKVKVLANRDVQSAVRSMRNLTSKAVTPVLEQLEAFGWLFKGAPLRAGAPPIWRVNLVAHNLFSQRAKVESERREEIREIIAKTVKNRRATDASQE